MEDRTGGKNTHTPGGRQVQCLWRHCRASRIGGHSVIREWEKVKMHNAHRATRLSCGGPKSRAR